MFDVPNEIWVIIAAYIPDSEVRSLYGVNRVFFDLAMNIRYREIHISTLTYGLDRLLEHLRQDHVARRIRSLSLCPHLMPNLVSKDPPPPQRQTRLRDRISVLKARLGAKLPGANIEKRTASITTCKSAAQVWHDLEIVLEKSLCMEELHCLNWKNTSALEVLPHPGIWAGFSTNLRRLDLRLTSAVLLPLLRSNVRFTRLHTFQLTLMGTHGPGGIDESVCISSLAAFLNGLSNTLQFLALGIWKLDGLSPFFSKLTCFPLLTKLLLNTHLDDRHLSNPVALGRFIRCHAERLEEFSLLHTPCEGCLGPSRSGFDIDGMLENLCFPNLTSLHLSAIIYFVADTTDTVRSKSGFQAPLRSLRLDSAPLSHAELERFTSFFAETVIEPPVRSLHLRIFRLTKEVLNLLANAFPSLHSLTLVVSRIADDPEDLSDASRDAAASLTQDGAHYSDWNLRDITIIKVTATGQAHAIHGMFSVASKISRIHTLCGNASMPPSYYVPYMF